MQLRLIMACLGLCLYFIYVKVSLLVEDIEYIRDLQLTGYFPDYEDTKTIYEQTSTRLLGAEAEFNSWLD
jgi:hypothetical protein